MAIDWNTVYKETAADSAAMYEDQRKQAEAAKAAEAAALSGQASYFNSLLGSELQAEQQQAGLVGQARRQRMEKAAEAMGAPGMSQTAATALLSNSQRMSADAQRRYGEATDALALTQAQLNAEREARYAGVMAALAQAQAQDAREEGRFRYEAGESARRYDEDLAYKNKKHDLQNQQWAAEHNLRVQDYETYKSQWQQEFDTKKAQWQAEFDQSGLQWQQKQDFAREQFAWQKQKQQAAKAKSASAKKSSRKRAGKSSGKGSGKQSYALYDRSGTKIGQVTADAGQKKIYQSMGYVLK